MAKVEAIGKRHAGSVSLHHVYILEAHADDEWKDPDNATDQICFRKPTTLEQRIAIARSFAMDSGIETDRVVVDSMANSVELAYEARPEKLLIVQDGRIVFKSGIGPYQYSAQKLAAFLDQELSSTGSSSSSASSICVVAAAAAALLAAAAFWRR